MIGVIGYVTLGNVGLMAFHHGSHIPTLACIQATAARNLGQSFVRAGSLRDDIIGNEWCLTAALHARGAGANGGAMDGNPFGENAFPSAGTWG